MKLINLKTEKYLVLVNRVDLFNIHFCILGRTYFICKVGPNYMLILCLPINNEKLDEYFDCT